MSTIVSIGRQPPNSIVGEINLQQQQQNLMPIPACLTPTLALLTLIVPALISLIDLKFQKGSESVFQVHPVTTMVVVVSLLTFVMSLGIVLTFRTYHPSDVASSLAALLHTTVVFSGSLSLASLASLLLPDALRPFLYVCCALLSLGYLLSLVQGIVRRFTRDSWINFTLYSQVCERIWADAFLQVYQQTSGIHSP